jgi:hypothetical protein
MRRHLRWVVLAGVVILIGTLHLAGAILAGVGLVILTGYLLRRHPLRDCTSCHGSKGHPDFIWSGAFGKCHKCRGSGVRPRPAVSVLMPDTARSIRNGGHGKHY